MADFFDDLSQSINAEVEEKYKKKLEEDAKNGLNEFHFDRLKMYFGEPYKVNDYITITQPSIQDIIDIGEDKLWSSIAPFTSNTTSYRVQLWEMGIDWNKISDWDLFCILYRTLTPQNTSLIIQGTDISSLEALKDQNDVVMLYIVNKDDNGNIIDVGDPVINEMTYKMMAEYIRTMFNQHPKVQFAKGKATKKAIIAKEKREMMEKRLKDEKSDSFLLPLISALLNHPGFKYDKEQLRKVGIVEFMDSVQRLQAYEQSTAFLKGMYSGFMDTKSLSQEQLNDSVNWMRDLNIKHK